MSSSDRFDAVVVGAGFGGLATALTLAESGARVALCETLNYPGGCASTFERRGFRFEAGATLFSGLDPGQLFGDWIRRHRLNVIVDNLDPVVEVRTPQLRIPIGSRRGQLLETLCAIPGAPVASLRRFFATQRRLADSLWPLLDDPNLMPPVDRHNIRAHLSRLGPYALVARWAGRPLRRVLEHYRLLDFEPLRIYLDALCQITVQCGIRDAEAPLALAAMDYYHHGTGHVRGGIGTLAWGLTDSIRRCGGDVRLANRVRDVQRRGDGWRVESREGTLYAERVVMNLLPQTAQKLVAPHLNDVRSIRRLAQRVSDGWGATMLYLVAREPAGAPETASHLELIADPAEPFVEGNHVFASISGRRDEGRAGDGRRTITASTHVAQARVRSLSTEDRGRLLHAVQQRMRRTLERLAPEWWAGVEVEMTASPRTFARFIGRAEGLVGGIPRTAGLHNYLGTGPFAPIPGLYLVGDSVLPGQGTLAVATGGVRLARQIIRDLGADSANDATTARTSVHSRDAA